MGIVPPCLINVLKTLNRSPCLTVAYPGDTAKQLVPTSVKLTTALYEAMVKQVYINIHI